MGDIRTRNYTKDGMMADDGRILVFLATVGLAVTGVIRERAQLSPIPHPLSPVVPPGSRAAAPSLRDLERALDQTALVPTGSRDRRKSKGTQTGATKTDATETLWDLFLTMEPSLVPDDLLVAVLLAGTTKKSPRLVSADLLREAGGDLAKIVGTARSAGIGDQGRARLAAASELYRRAAYRTALGEKPIIRSTSDAFAVLRTMATGPDERMVALYLDNRNRVVGSRVHTIGSKKFTIVDPVQILKAALELDASAFILAHQHPSEDVTPSSQDRDVTHRVHRAAQALGVQMLDHLVVGRTGYTSFAESGELPPWSSPVLHTGSRGVVRRGRSSRAPHFLESDDPVDQWADRYVVQISDRLDVVVAVSRPPSAFEELREWYDVSTAEGWHLASLDMAVPGFDDVLDDLQKRPLHELVDVGQAVQRTDDHERPVEDDVHAVLHGLRQGLSAIRLPDALSGEESRYYRWYLVLPIPDRPRDKQQVRLRRVLLDILKGRPKLPLGQTIPLVKE